MYTRCLDPSVLAFSLSLYRHPSICILFNAHFTSIVVVVNEKKTYKSTDTVTVLGLVREKKSERVGLSRQVVAWVSVGKFVPSPIQTVPSTSEKFLPSPISHAHFDTSPPGDFGRNGSHWKTDWTDQSDLGVLRVHWIIGPPSWISRVWQHIHISVRTHIYQYEEVDIHYMGLLRILETRAEETIGHDLQQLQIYM